MVVGHKQPRLSRNRSGSEVKGRSPAAPGEAIAGGSQPMRGQSRQNRSENGSFRPSPASDRAGARDVSTSVSRQESRWPLGKSQVIRPELLSPQKRGPSQSAAALRARLAWGLRSQKVDGHYLQRKRVAFCRTVRTAPTVQLIERTSEDGTGRLVLSGVTTCGSVHSCPQCAAAIMTRRGAEVSEALDAHRHHAALVTLTIRHHAGIPLAVLRVLLSRAYSEMFAGNGGQKLKAALGLVGHVRAAEQTYGDNGWHPHLHALWFLGGAPEEGWEELVTKRWLTVVAQIYRRLWDVCSRARHSSAEDCESKREYYARHVGSAYAQVGSVRAGLIRFGDRLKAMGGLEAVLPSEEHAVRSELVRSDEHAATYLTKMGLELTGILNKEAQGESMTSWQIAQRAAAGDEDCARLWREHSFAMKGARQLTWSRGLRDYLGLEPERSDEELAREEELEESEVDRPLANVRGDMWDICARQQGQLWVAYLYEAYESGELFRNFDGPERRVRPPPDIAPMWWNRLSREARAVQDGGSAWRALCREHSSRTRAARKMVYSSRAERELETEEAIDRCRDELEAVGVR